MDLAEGELRVARTLDCKTRTLIDGAKRPSRLRTLPLPPEVRRLLRERWNAEGRPAEGLIVRTPDGRPLSLGSIRLVDFKPALEAAEITRDMRIDDLRHGFATAALEAGADANTVADLLGHGSTFMTQHVYQHVTDARKRETARRIWQRHDEA